MQWTEAGPDDDTERAAVDWPPRRSRWLNDPRSRVVAAAIPVAAATVVGLVGFYAARHAGSPPSPAISMMIPGAGSRIGPFVRVSGRARNLRPQQMVWVFIQFIHPNETPSRNVYPALGPCPIGKNQIWTCANVQVGKADDYGKQYKIWAAIVTDRQAYWYATLIASAHGNHSFNPAGGNSPPHVTGTPGVTGHLVTRCASGPRSCPVG